MDLLPMLAAAAGNAGEEADEDFANTVLLLHGDGTNGAQNNTFLDSSTNNFTITRNGNTTQGTFSPFSKSDGAWANYFSGSSTGILINTSLTAISTSDFTIELWVYPISYGISGLSCLYDERSGSVSALAPCIYFDASGLYYFTNNGAQITASTLTLNTFSHIAVCRSGSSTKMFVNGTQVGSTYTDTLTYVAPSYLYLGRFSNVGTYFTQGYISNVRRVLGTALYTTSFTPSTTPLTAISGTSVLTCQSNRFKDNSTNNYALTIEGNVKVTLFSPFPITTAYSPSVNGGAGYFDGSGDYISIPDNAAFALGSNDWTLECWVYITGGNNAQVFIGQYAASGADSTIGFLLGTNASQYPYIASYINGSYQAATSSTVLSLNQWHHVAGTRSGSTLGIFLNGNRLATTTVSGSSVDSTAIVTVGAGQSGSAGLVTGYVSSARLVNGTAIYDSATYTVPASPLTAVTNTSLLCNFTNAGILDNTCFNALETVGNAQIDTTTKKYGTGSLSFDGTGDNLTIASNPSVWFGSGAFTIEMWLYPNDAASEQMLVAGSDTGSLFLGMNIDGANRIALGRKGVAVDNQVSYTYSTGAWIHLACVRDSSNNIYFFVDGTQVGSTGTNSNSFTNSTLNIGFEPTQKYFNGFIDDLRISRIARYTTTFTSPTKAFPDLGE